MTRALMKNEPDVDLYVWINNLNQDGDSGGQGTAGKCKGVVCSPYQSVMARGPSRGVVKTAEVKLIQNSLSMTNLIGLTTPRPFNK